MSRVLILFHSLQLSAQLWQQSISKEMTAFLISIVDRTGIKHSVLNCPYLSLMQGPSIQPSLIEFYTFDPHLQHDPKSFEYLSIPQPNIGFDITWQFAF